MSATSAPSSLVAGEQAEVGVQPRGLRVVVAGPDVHVVAHAVALAAHDEDALGVRLQRRVAVDDVHAGLLERARPADVRPLVEARLELHEADRLLAALGRADERRDERRVVARAVDRQLDRQHVGVGDRLLDEALDRRGERVVRVVDEDVALAHRREHVDLAVLALQARLGDRRPRRVAQLARGRAARRSASGRRGRAARRRRRPGAPRPRAPRRAARAAPGPCPASTSTRTTSPKRRRRSSASTARSRSSASSEISKSASRVTRKKPWSRISIPGNSASRFAAMTSSSGTKRRPRPTSTKRGSISFGTFTRANVVLAVLRVAHQHGEAQRQVRDVRERPAEPDGQRREHREDLAAEALGELLALLVAERLAADDADAVLGQRGQQLGAQAARLALEVAQDPLADRVEHLRRRAPVGARLGDARVDLVVHAGDADHEELVEVRRVDRGELHALEQRDRRVLGELEHALVEVQPRELAVEVQVGVVARLRRALELERLQLGGGDRGDRLLVRRGHGVVNVPERRARQAGAFTPCSRSAIAYSSRAANPSRSRSLQASQEVAEQLRPARRELDREALEAPVGVGVRRLALQPVADQVRDVPVAQLAGAGRPAAAASRRSRGSRRAGPGAP